MIMIHLVPPHPLHLPSRPGRNRAYISAGVFLEGSQESAFQASLKLFSDSERAPRAHTPQVYVGPSDLGSAAIVWSNLQIQVTAAEAQVSLASRWSITLHVLALALVTVLRHSLACQCLTSFFLVRLCPESDVCRAT